ncbi:MAG: hypothetical protein WDW38_000607 [Sanguina aurantia]
MEGAAMEQVAVVADEGATPMANFKSYVDVPVVQTTTVSEPVLDASGSAVKDKAGNAVMKPVQVSTQTLPMGPAASQIAIKQLGTNGGGFFNVNSAHPYENPTPFSNFLELLSILLIPAALCYTFGELVKDKRQGWALLAVMLVIFVPLLIACTSAEQAGNPAFNALHVDQRLRPRYTCASANMAASRRIGKAAAHAAIDSTR